MSEPVDILALGEALIEMMRQPGEEARPLFRQGFGGDTSNAIIAAARQGASTGYISAVGRDPFGESLLNLWRDEGVSCEHVSVAERDPTGVYFVDPHPSGRRFYYARRGSAASLYSASDLPKQAIADSRVLHVSAISQAVSPSMRGAVLRAAEHARGHDTLVSFDTNLRLNMWPLEEARAAMQELLPFTDILFPSDDEAVDLTGRSDRDAIIDFFHGNGVGTVILKCGADGAVVSTKTAKFTVPAQPSNPVDSTGAGDSFAGSFLAYFLETNDPERAANLAARVAAGTVSGMGAVDPIPRRDDVLG